MPKKRKEEEEAEERRTRKRKPGTVLWRSATLRHTTHVAVVVILPLRVELCTPTSSGDHFRRASIAQRDSIFLFLGGGGKFSSSFPRCTLLALPLQLFGQVSSTSVYGAATTARHSSTAELSCRLVSWPT